MSSLFSDIIGHDAACEILNRSLKANRLAHAYLFIGPDHVGRTTLARALLRGFLHMEDDQRLQAHPDATIVERATNAKTGKKKTIVSVEQIRGLRKKLSQSALRGDRKAAFVVEAHKMHTAAANALLKTLEEPSGDTCIILRAPQVDAVPTTIASRCQHIRLHPVSRDVIADMLTARNVASEQAQRYAALSLGRPGLALRLMERGGLSETRQGYVDQFLHVLQADVPARLRLADDLNPGKDDADKRRTMQTILTTWEQVLRDILLVRVGCRELCVHQDKQEAVVQLANRSSERAWRHALEAVDDTRRAVDRNVNTQLAFEHALLSIPS